MSAAVEDEGEDAAEEKWIRELTSERPADDLDSPIDLNIATMTVKKLRPLIWCHYGDRPKKLKMTNTGKTVALSAKWQQESPFLTCGPFLSRHIFSQVHFHWGFNDMDGSEHSVDGGSLPMELHAVHFNSEYPNQIVAMRKPDGISILVYFFKSLENPKMNEIVKMLPCVQLANSSTRITPWAITNLIRPFGNDYFLYKGSISSQNYCHRILWLISRRPIGISVEQVAEFRKMKDKKYEPLDPKCRVLHERRGQKVYHVNPSGSMYASLLPTPRDNPPQDAMDTTDCCDSVAEEEIGEPGEPSTGA